MSMKKFWQKKALPKLLKYNGKISIDIVLKTGTYCISLFFIMNYK